MIDEDLYQKAADELDSERRRTDVWARACALANDDHDEARFLYTNLRVEELMSGADEGDGSAALEAASPGEHPELDLAGFESLTEPGDGIVAAVAAERGADAARRAEADGGGTPRASAGREPIVLDLGHEDGVPEHDDGRALDRAPDPALDGGDAARETDPSRSGLVLPARAGTDGLPFEQASLDGAANGPRGVVDEASRHAAVQALDHPLDGLPDAAGPDDGIDDTIALDLSQRIPPGTHPHALDELDRLDEVYRAERQSLASPPPVPDLDDEADELTRELRRQADELPGAGAVIAHEPSGPREANGAHEPHDTLPMRRVGSARDASAPHGAGRDDALAARDADARDGPFALASDQPLELDDEGGGDTEYAVFVPPSGKRRAQAVRQGGSWGALLATLPWLLYRHLFGTAIVYVLLAAAVLTGLAVTGLTWLEIGADATFATKSATIGFALLAVAGLIVVPFRNANHWREDKLERRGFELVAYVRARDAGRAIELTHRRTGRQAPP